MSAFSLCGRADTSLISACLNTYNSGFNNFVFIINNLVKMQVISNIHCFFNKCYWIMFPDVNLTHKNLFLLKAAESAQEKVKGDFQGATQAQSAALAALQAFVGPLNRGARVACKDRSDLLTKLGL